MTTAALALGLCTKANALVILLWITLSLIIKAWLAPRHSASWKRNLAALLFVAVMLSPLFIFLKKPFFPYGDYYKVISQSSTGFEWKAYNERRKLGIPSDRYFRPGFISVDRTYFTFRLWDLIQHPYITLYAAPSPVHRTSLWSQLYGRFHFGHFDRVLWSRMDRPAKLLGGAIMLTAFLPTLMLPVGFLASLLSALQALISRRAQLFSQRHDQWCFGLQALLYVAMLLVYMYDHPSFTSMKDIYLLPGLLGFAWLFLAGLRGTMRALWQYPGLQRALIVNCRLLVALYLAEHALVLSRLYL